MRQVCRKKNIKNELNSLTYPTAKTESLIRQLNPIIRGWTNYFRHVVSKKIFSYADSLILQILMKWIVLDIHKRIIIGNTGATLKLWILLAAGIFLPLATRDRVRQSAYSHED